jgi:lipopolysaccharide transport system ATP-binding protein
MYVRLAFSVTSFLRTEILIVDEVLSVGDQQFQNKCINRLQDIIAQGRTVLFVSHGAGLIRKICSRAICLKQGALIFDGEPNMALDYYQESQKTHEPELIQAVDSPTGEPGTGEPEAEAPSASQKAQPKAGETVFAEDRRPGDDVTKILSCRVMTRDGATTPKVCSNQEVLFQMTFRVFKEGYCLRPGANVYDELGNALFWTADPALNLRKDPLPVGDYSATFVIPKDFLAPGLIIIGAGVGGVSGISHAYAGDCVLFLVEDDLSESSVRGGYMGPLGGFVRPRLRWETTAFPRRENSPVPQSA